ncbi:MAG: transposase [Thermodesulfobacteriota bacterium]
MKFKYQRINSAVRESLWHVVWCTKYRYKVFRKFHHKNFAETCIRNAACKHGIKILEIKAPIGVSSKLYT